MTNPSHCADQFADQFNAVTLEQARAAPGIKWNRYAQDVIPSWIADMDFPAPMPIRALLRAIADAGDLGYAGPEGDARLPELFARRMAERYGWHPDPGAIDTLADIVQAIHLAVETLCGRGQRVIVNTPCYHPILTACRDLGREILPSPMVEVDGAWRVDFERLEAAIDDSVKLLILVNPHNPSGRCFRRAELERFAELALQHDLQVVADEVHCDLVFADAGPHIPFASLGPDIAARTLTCNSATKSHNLGGIRCSLIHYGSPALRRRFARWPRRFHGGDNLLGRRATEVAWRQCDDWLAGALAYLQGNRDWLARQLRAELPQLRHIPNEATYLAWIDCRALGLEEDPAEFLLREARVACYSGRPFGAEEGFIRLNFATSRQILEEKMARIAGAVKRLGG